MFYYLINTYSTILKFGKKLLLKNWNKFNQKIMRILYNFIWKAMKRSVKEQT